MDRGWTNPTALLEPPTGLNANESAEWQRLLHTFKMHGELPLALRPMADQTQRAVLQQMTSIRQNVQWRQQQVAGRGVAFPVGSIGALQGYQMQPALLEEQNKRRFFMARQQADELQAYQMQLVQLEQQGRVRLCLPRQETEEERRAAQRVKGSRL
ncbi:uncharacterized protein J3D65DRAFT_634527 [Phyllosticta citribraziliensis]|uniref:Uncharacterized protein n=1 Tax=Phyllosticta citribraziliensis TaxID=989973 RepID=A0ABR1LEQ1_9PEZI